ncbi:uncharacterized protein F4807DRAFT_465432 [Annulohypoxylon truncatum]|uniref:uncharacterized protein n=1 Tax=Annulohypoxylon truncatum TaxID=327061 RepID=UPI002007488D|nr:uncharacterized protein F4807DRAFT_465432 [Annulohypoxylon truncatum]KAI1204658.1 hypothetical protein F4807DRAFT_465432 [Annulohypoxylon truncatum]
MFSRLRSEQPTPRKSESPARFKDLKRRLFDEDEEPVNMSPPSPKRRKKGYYSVAPLFDKYKGREVDEDGQPSNRHHGHHRRPSPSPDPEQPLVKELDGKNLNNPGLQVSPLPTLFPDRYANLRATIHSAAISSLASTESQLSAASESSIRANRQKLLSLNSEIESLAAPLQSLSVDYMATGEDGLPRTVAVSMKTAISAFEEKLESTVAELDGIWAEWEQINAEIEELGSNMGILPRKAPGLTHAGGGGVRKGTAVPSSTSASHSEALVKFDTDLKMASKDAIEEMTMYEEKFLSEIEKEAGNILHSFLDR